MFGPSTKEINWFILPPYCVKTWLDIKSEASDWFSQNLVELLVY
jgi:hypothetical protein